MSTHYFGAHTIDNGGIDMAARRAGASAMQALQIFTAVPKYYNEKIGVRPERAERFREALKTTEIPARRVIAHAAYVLNVATPDETKWGRANAGLTKELERATILGLGMVCFHPGAATDGDRVAGAKRVGQAITNALRAVEGETKLLVENTAGAGNTVGRTPEEVGMILASVPDSLRHRTGYGLDTCHLFAAGYDLAFGPDAAALILDEFENATGVTPTFFHLNDSAGALGSNVDRHELIGEGQVGKDAFRWLLADRRTRGIPLVLETPQKNYDVAEDDPSPDPWDEKMMRLLETLAGD
ncbi:MAG: deoxyribonuclease IV [Gemmatimonadaceae bacterium]|nr:deoxyribonuclease IV [Gemmatimonadaceae bacterium]NUQ93266.1 deoxyribonuclease IV [Gemmatimonadaceae bacterium]NUR19758.1 deoxyribonuclease IV [Gemmatimonadaceae bacterium]